MTAGSSRIAQLSRSLNQIKFITYTIPTSNFKQGLFTETFFFNFDSLKNRDARKRFVLENASSLRLSPRFETLT